jgi:prephenate dehydrogenase
MRFERIAIIGCGLIGGSFALALKKGGFAGEIAGWDRADVLEKAKDRGAIERAAKDLADAVVDADLVYLAAPVVAILDLLPQLALHLKPGALVTDAGSTKARICRQAREALPKGVFFLGGHPMAGKEASGIENASADLFAAAKYIVIKDTNRRGPENAEIEFLDWVRKMGAEPVEMDAETHDWAVAFVSHLPQLVSTALASAVWDQTDDDGLPVALAGTGFRDMTRLAASPFEIWRDIGLTNGDNIRRALERLRQKLEHMEENLQSKQLAEEFDRAQRAVALLVRDGRREP